MKLLTKHLNDVGETYFQHMKQALTISLRLGLACIAQLVHAVFPFVSPPLGTDTKSLLNFLDSKLPSNRKENGGEQ